MLWLAIHLPDFALEVFGPADEAAAVCGAPANRPLIHACNGAAAATGVHPGQPLGAALAICPALRHRSRERSLEDEALTGLGLWAQQYTSMVHLTGGGLLLEVGGSLRLFGGLERLHGRVAAELEILGYHGRLAAAPTPLGAWLLARNHPGLRVEGREELQHHLDRLPVTAMELADDTLATLRGLGLRRIGECRRLPRASLARRAGPELLDYLDRAFGHRPDPREPFSPPRRFDRRVPLPAEVETTDALLFAARRLILELVGLLRARGAGVQAMTLRLEHRGRPASRVGLGLARPSRDPDHLLALLRERLERFELPAPADAVALEAERFPDLERSQPDLFAPERAGAGDAPPLLEKLRARLGEEAVVALRPLADHRPERAWRPCLPDEPTGGAGTPARPLWLLPEPRPLESRQDRPWLGTALQLRQGPERIESGWWDGEDASRDYFVAEDAGGERFWVYRDRRGGGWFLQGVFG